MWCAGWWRCMARGSGQSSRRSYLVGSGSSAASGARDARSVASECTQASSTALMSFVVAGCAPLSMYLCDAAGRTT
jgi:hypothetical protein